MPTHSPLFDTCWLEDGLEIVESMHYGSLMVSDCSDKPKYFQCLINQAATELLILDFYPSQTCLYHHCVVYGCISYQKVEGDTHLLFSVSITFKVKKFYAARWPFEEGLLWLRCVSNLWNTIEPYSPWSDLMVLIGMRLPVMSHHTALFVFSIMHTLRVKLLSWMVLIHTHAHPFICSLCLTLVVWKMVLKLLNQCIMVHLW